MKKLSNPLLALIIIAFLVINITCKKDDSSCGETITYGEQVYNTVLIGNQCWMAENLNVGKMILNDRKMGDNDTIEKWCYENNPENCEVYGGLYQWDEIMKYEFKAGTQGICPNGWHIPTDEEWKILEGTVDSEYPVGDPEWDKQKAFRGFDVGHNLKTTYGWSNNRNGADLYGFGALPAGVGVYNSEYGLLGEVCEFWTSHFWSSAEVFVHTLHFQRNGSLRSYGSNSWGFSVRCIKN
jgi:uncharacterized protein (TIGR02145 family)